MITGEHNRNCLLHLTRLLPNIVVPYVFDDDKIVKNDCNVFQQNRKSKEKSTNTIGRTRQKQTKWHDMGVNYAWNV